MKVLVLQSLISVTSGAIVFAQNQGGNVRNRDSRCFERKTIKKEELVMDRSYFLTRRDESLGFWDGISNPAVLSNGSVVFFLKNQAIFFPPKLGDEKRFSSPNIQFDHSTNTSSAPVVLPNDTVAIPGLESKKGVLGRVMVFVKPDGSMKTAPLSGDEVTGITLWKDSNVMVAQGKKLICFSQHGEKLFEQSLPKAASSAPIVGENNSIIVGIAGPYEENGDVAVFDTKKNIVSTHRYYSRDSFTSFDIRDSIKGIFRGEDDDKAVLMTNGNRFLIVDPNKNKTLAFPALKVDFNYTHLHGGAVFDDGTVVITGSYSERDRETLAHNDRGVVAFLNSKGETTAITRLPSAVTSDPVLLDDGVAVTTLDGHIVIVSKDGAIKNLADLRHANIFQPMQPPTTLRTTPAVLNDGRIVVAAQNGMVAFFNCHTTDSVEVVVEVEGCQKEGDQHQQHLNGVADSQKKMLRDRSNERDAPNQQIVR